MGVISLIVLLAFGGLDGLLLMDNPFYRRKDLASIPLSRLLAAAGIFFSIVMATPLAIAGWGILRWRPWARLLGMLVAGVNMISFPIGTAVGIYAIWVLNDETAEFLFNNAPAGGGKR